jgi:hypothetical protein
VRSASVSSSRRPAPTKSLRLRLALWYATASAHCSSRLNAIYEEDFLGLVPSHSATGTSVLLSSTTALPFRNSISIQDAGFPWASSKGNEALILF